ncbi:MAG: hypothetical protein ACE5I1_16095 [bacterium]
MIELLRFCRQQLQTQNTPSRLFESTPLLTFEAEQKVCPIDGQPLHVQKTYTRTVKAIGIGTYKAHHIALYCKEHRELGPWRSTELDKLVPAHCNAAYDIIVEVGKLRFMENRQVKEIEKILFQKHSLELSPSEIERLIDRFIFYVAAVHQESSQLINLQIKEQGGYILHLDTTCEKNSPKLASSIDSVSGFVLHAAKLNSENKDEVMCFLEQIKSRFGSPHAVVSDMSKGIEAAAQEIFGDIAHYICHFHFLRAIGVFLLEEEHGTLRKALSKVGISGKLKSLVRKISRSAAYLAFGDIEDDLSAPERLGKTRETTDMLASYLMLWILDHASEGNSYGFPFDHRYLSFYGRLETAKAWIEEIKSYYPAKTENDKMLWKLYHLIEEIVGDRALRNTVTQYKTKLAVFSDLRKALGIASEPTKNGLTQTPVSSSRQEIQKIRTAVEAFMRKLNKQIQKTTEQQLRASLKKIKEQITEYEERLFADPLIVEANGEKKLFFVQRTNNIMEQHFRLFNYARRRVHGNQSVRRNLENIPEQLPLVENLKNPKYMKLIFDSETEIAKRFSEIEAKTIRKMAEEHSKKKKSLCSRKTKRIIRDCKFKKQLIAAFAIVAS